MLYVSSILYIFIYKHLDSMKQFMYTYFKSTMSYKVGVSS